MRRGLIGLGGGAPAPSIEFVGAGAVARRAGAGTANISRPTVAAGDTMIAVVLSASVPTPPSGWTQVLARLEAGYWLTAHTRQATASEASSWGWANVSYGGGFILVYRGAAASPVRASAFEYQAGTGIIRFPSVAATAGDALVCVAGVTSDMGSPTAPSGLTNRLSSSSVAGSFYAADLLAVPGGPTGTRDTTTTGGNAHAVSLALIPA